MPIANPERSAKARTIIVQAREHIRMPIANYEQGSRVPATVGQYREPVRMPTENPERSARVRTIEVQPRELFRMPTDNPERRESVPTIVVQPREPVRLPTANPERRIATIPKADTINVDSRTLQDTLIWLLVAIFCGCHVGYITSQYLEYGTATHITISRYLPITAPSINLCLDINEMEIDRGNGSITDRDEFSAESVFLATPSSSDIVIDCLVHKHGSYDSLVDSNCSALEINKFKKRSKVCYSVRLRSSQPYQYLDIADSEKPLLFDWFLNREHFTKCEMYKFYMKSRNKHFYGNGATFIRRDTKIKNETSGERNSFEITLSYSSFQSKLLPAPYKSKCIVYSDIGFESREHCQEACIINKTVSRFNRIPASVLIGTDHPHRHLSVTDPYNETMKAEERNFRTECRSKCSSPDCFDEDIVPKITFIKDVPYSLVILHASNEPTIITEAVVQTSMVEYSTLIVSCLSFWLGFCPVAFLLKVNFMRICRKRNAIAPSRPADLVNSEHLKLTRQNCRDITVMKNEQSLFDERLDELASRWRCCTCCLL